VVLEEISLGLVEDLVGHPQLVALQLLRLVVVQVVILEMVEVPSIKILVLVVQDLVVEEEQVGVGEVVMLLVLVEV
jgi:hypothetical protein